MKRDHGEVLTAPDVRKRLFEEKEARAAKKKPKKAAKAATSKSKASVYPCVVCDVIWDGKKGDDWVQCDDCDGWICEDCVKNINPNFDFENAEDAGNFYCSNCSQ